MKLVPYEAIAYLKGIRYGKKPLHNRLVLDVVRNQQQVAKNPRETHHCYHCDCINNSIYHRRFFSG